MMTNRNSPLQQETFAFLDIETTGGNPQRDRITEIGIRFWRAGEVVGEWQTLLNPEARIAGFIERLTGITNAMVADAPLFADIADELERHQAMGDVAAMLAFFEHARAEHGSDAINNAIWRLLQRQSTPSNVPASSCPLWRNRLFLCPEWRIMCRFTLSLGNESLRGTDEQRTRVSRTFR